MHQTGESISEQHAPPTVGARHIGRTLARDGAVLLVLVIVLELVLQVAAPAYRRHLFDDRFTGGFPMERGPEGLRGTVPPKEPVPGELRVMTLGDSVAMGTGVPASRTFAHALAPELARLASRPVTTINAGVEGWALKEMRTAFESRLSGYRPGVVVIAVTGNMVSRAWIERDRVVTADEVAVGEPPEPAGLRALKTRANRLAKRLCTPSFVSLNVQRGMYALGLLNHSVDPGAPFGAMLAHGWEQIGLDPAIAGEAWTLFERDLGALCAAVKARGATVIVTATPARFMLSDRAFDNEKFVARERITIDPGKRVRGACAAIGVEYVDALAALRTERASHGDAPLYIQFDYTHLDEHGHAVVGLALAREIAAHPAP